MHQNAFGPVVIQKLSAMIAGKGHENYQEIKGRRSHFSDKEIAEKYLHNRKRSRNRRAACYRLFFAAISDMPDLGLEKRYRISD